MPRINLFKTALILAASALAAGPALAQSADWTGAYIGAGIGGASGKLDFPGLSVDGSGIAGGLLAGYDYDLGTWVIGGGVDIDFTGASITDLDIDRIWRLKARGGVKTGNALIYATGGFANVALSSGGNIDEDGYFIGGGVEFQTQSNFSIGGEVLYHQFDNIAATPIDLSVITYQIRGAYRF